ncbi:MAG: hypothetical protein JW909_01465 [Planctomycetes bacterium]|nr:hypothetical protein [Planctomycetota bacterium]
MSMTMKQRMLAVVRGEHVDRVPFVQYSGLAAPDGEIWNAVGRGDMGLLKWTSAHKVHRPRCSIESAEFQQDGLRGVRSVLHTPSGSLTEEKLFEPAFNTAHTSRHFVQDVDDYEILLEFVRDAVVSPDPEQLAAVVRDLADDGLPHVSVGRTPFQQLWVEWVSIEKLCLHMLDAPSVMDEVTSALADLQRRAFAAAAQTDAPYLVFADNITAPIIGERYFREFCVPLYDELAAMLKPSGRLVYVHMDGDLKPLWRAIGESGVRGLDSLSPPPDNDTSIADAVRMWPEMRLAMNFPSSVHLQDPERVYRAAMDILRQGAPSGRLWIQISENVPPGVWRTSFPAIIRAVHDFAGSRPAAR